MTWTTPEDAHPGRCRPGGRCIARYRLQRLQSARSGATRVRERVEEAARRLGYDGPDPRAAAEYGKFNAIGCMPPGAYAIADVMRSPYGRELMLGVALVCDDVGATLRLINGTDETRTASIREALVDGFILGNGTDIELIASVKRRWLPFVILESDAGRRSTQSGSMARSGAIPAAFGT